MIKMKQWLWLAGFCVALAAQATTLLPMSLEELTRRSDQIVVAKVTNVSYAQNTLAGYPETRTVFTVESVVFGDEKTRQVVVAVPGGPSGNGLMTIVPGMPKFKVDERAILFLVQDKARNVAFPTGAEQGVFRIILDPKTQTSFVLNQSHDLSVIQVPNNPVQEKNKDKSRIPLLDFTTQIRQLATQVKDQ